MAFAISKQIYLKIEKGDDHIMIKKNKKQRSIHYGMASVGGFLGGFAILSHQDLLANAQTSNLISLAISILGRNPFQAVLHIGSLLLYMLGLSLTVLIPKYTRWNLRLCSITIDALCLIVLAILPRTLEDFIALYPIFFALAFQWNTFKGADGYIASSIFSTNNLSQFTTSLTEYFCDRDRNHLHKTSFYGGTLLFFHIGVAISYFACKSLGTAGSLAGLLPLGLSLFLILTENTKLRKKLTSLRQKAA